MKKLLPIAPFITVIAILIFGSYLYYTPYAAVKAMRDAAEAGDADSLSHYVDFPSVRESLKSAFNARLAAETLKNKDTNPFEAFGSVIASALINQLADTLVTPQGLAAMMKGDKSGELEKKPSTGVKPEAEVAVNMSYLSLNSFMVKVSKKNRAQDDINLIFTREGLTDWQLTMVHFAS